MQPSNSDRDSGRWSPPISSSYASTRNGSISTEIADDVQHTLQHSGEHEELKTSFLDLLNLFDTMPNSVEAGNTYFSVMATMSQMSTDVEIQKIGLEILYKFIKERPEMEEKMRHQDTFRHIIRLLSGNPSNDEIQNKAMCILLLLLKCDKVKRQIFYNRLWPFILEAIMKNLAHLPQGTDIVHNSFIILTHTLNEDKSLQDVFAENHLEVLMEVLKINDKNAEIVKTFFQVCIIAATEDKGKMQVAVHLPNIVTEISTWQSDFGIVGKGFELIEVLCHLDSLSQMMVNKGVIMQLVLPEIMSKIDDPEIQFNGLKIFVLSATHLFNDSMDDLASQWLKVIYLAMARHMGNALVQSQSCKALSRLLECKPEVYMWIGESSELKQDPVHTLCLGAILMYEKDEEVFIASCKAIYYLTADNDGLCKNLMEKNSHVAIIEGLRCHKKNTRAVTAACRAIRGLSIFQNEHKQEIASYNGDLLQLLVEIIKSCPGTVEVQSEVISTIACLADIDLFRHQAYVVGMHQHVLNAMEIFPGDEILQEAAIEAMAVLGGATSGPDILHSSGAVTKVIRCMKRFVYNSNIQKKGLMTIQILSESSLVQSPAMCQELATIIKQTMKNNTNNLVIQKEAIVAMQILAESGVEGDRQDQYSHMAEVLVNEECHELLFQILEKFDDDKGLHDLASECLYVLGVEQDLKSCMLLTACSRGFLAGAECLIEVGADVNIGHGSESPLGRAVCNNDEKMVQFLLSQEVQDVQTSLKLSLERGFHSIAGMLLSHIGQDKESKGEELECDGSGEGVGVGEGEGEVN